MIEGDTSVGRHNLYSYEEQVYEDSTACKVGETSLHILPLFNKSLIKYISINVDYML